MVDECETLLDDCPYDRDSIALTREKVSLKLWQAARLNRATFGDQPMASAVQVNVTLGMAHLQELQRRVVRATIVKPNETTAAAMLEARTGSLPTFDTVDDLLVDLDRESESEDA